VVYGSYLDNSYILDLVLADKKGLVSASGETLTELNNELSKSIKNTIQEVFGDEAQLRNLVLEYKEGHQYNGIMEIYYKDEITKYNIIVTDDKNTCTWEITNILENNKP
jgi:hypothetical protein